MPVSVPGGARPFANLATLERELESVLFRSGAFDLSALLRRALATGALEGLQMVKEFARALEQTTRSSKNQLANVHQKVAVEMKDAVVEAYDLKRALGRMAGPYRPEDRYTGGALHDALDSSEMFRATYDGIGFGNIVHLDGAAKQWYRLNFGVGERAGPRPRRFQIHWQGFVSEAMGYDNGPSREPLLMPQGIFYGPGAVGQQQFQPTRSAVIYPTKGVRAWNFLDAAPEAMTRLIGPAYEGLYERWHASSLRGVGPLSRVMTVRGSGGGRG